MVLSDRENVPSTSFSSRSWSLGPICSFPLTIAADCATVASHLPRIRSVRARDGVLTVLLFLASERASLRACRSCWNTLNCKMFHPSSPSFSILPSSLMWKTKSFRNTGLQVVSVQRMRCTDFCRRTKIPATGGSAFFRPTRPRFRHRWTRTSRMYRDQSLGLSGTTTGKCICCVGGGTTITVDGPSSPAPLSPAVTDSAFSPASPRVATLRFAGCATYGRHSTSAKKRPLGLFL
mmetsp:Transcript_12001/g.33827  ORF Transcript_12001/g.33827 Transcript_12001/m.33827 type:complete len:235 (-) Transcript_12001:3043-3747(-)